MMEISLFIPFAGLFASIKKKKLIYLLLFFINLLCLSFVFLVMRKSFDFSKTSFGHIPVCNKDVNKAICIEGFVFPLCYRCTFLFLGIYLGLLCLIICRPQKRAYLILISIILILPCILDEYADTNLEYLSNNIIRMTTGFLCGLSFSYLMYFPFSKNKVFSEAK